MFQSKTNRYVTRGVAEAVPVEVQLLLWSIIDEAVANGTGLDYFQIFELQGEDHKLTVVHRQEVPEFSQVRVFLWSSKEIAERKIWIIDSGEYQTMLFPEEY
jgi:hypothetical protein